MKDFYTDFEKGRDAYYSKLKSDYDFAIQIARKKINAHHIFEQTKMREESNRFNNELGQESRFLIEIRNAMDLDSRIEEPEEFNRRFEALSAKDKSKFLKGISEYEGLHLMYNYWHRRGWYWNAIENKDTDPIEIFVHLEDELARSFENILDIKQRDFLQNLELRSVLEEKISFAQGQINTVRNRIEGDLLYKFFNAFNQHHEKVVELVFSNFKNFDNVGLAVFGDLTEQANVAIAALLKHCASSPQEDNAKEFSALIKSLKDQGIESRALIGALNTKFENYEHRFLYVPFFFYYEKRFLSFLQSQLDKIKVSAGNEDSIVTNSGERNREFSTHRQVLAIHYLMDALGVYGKADKTEIARFIQFITGKETGAKDIGSTNIYKKLSKLLNKKEKNMDADLRFIRDYFEKLNLNSIAEKITKEIGDQE